MSRTNLLAVGVVCLGVGYLLGNFARIDNDRQTGGMQSQSRGEANARGASAQSPEDSQAPTADSRTIPDRAARAGASAAPADIQSLAACAAGAEAKTAERCLQRLDAIGIHDPQVRDAFLQALSAQQDLAAKARIFENITPAPLPPQERALFLKELEQLRRSPDPRVRADGLIRTAIWDRSETVADALREGLNDSDQDVVRAAATAVLTSNVRTQEIKDLLLILANDTEPDSQVHRNALEALDNFALDDDEYRIYRAARDRSDNKSGK